MNSDVKKNVKGGGARLTVRSGVRAGGLTAINHSARVRAR